MKKLFNKNAIVSVEIYDSFETSYKYIEKPKKFLWFFTRPVAYYYHDTKGKICYYDFIDEIKDNMYKKDDILYYKCYIKMQYCDNTVKIIYFNNDRERNEYVKLNFKSDNWQYRKHNWING